jgi:Exopolysaccharide biosynthesis protein YbjH
MSAAFLASGLTLCPTPNKAPRRRTALAGATAMALLASALPAGSEMRPGINLSGVEGIIDMPSAAVVPDGWLSVTEGRFGPINRVTLSYQITPRLSGSFRYVSIDNWNDTVCPPDCDGANAFETYLDRNFDLRYRVLDETRTLPSITIGLQDFVGTGLSMAEYIVASKTLGERLRVTAGLGFGRLASHGGRPGPFGDRPPVDFGNGGLANVGQWFRGDMAPFGGVEYRLSDKWTVKAEYSSDAYAREAGQRETFDWKSPLNFGIEYQRNDHMRVGLYALHGSEVGFTLSYLLNPDQRPMGGMGGAAPSPLKPRLGYGGNAGLYSTSWLQDPAAKARLIAALDERLQRDGLMVDSLGLSGDRAQLRFRNPSYDASAQAVGRVARAMALALPASVEVFEIVPVAKGMAGAKVTLRRSDLERLEFAPDAGALMLARTEIAPAGTAQLADWAPNEATQSRFTWSLGPWMQAMLFNPNEPLQVIFGAEARASYEFAPGIVVEGALTQSLTGGFRDSIPSGDPSPLPPVRSDSFAYYQNDGPALESLTASIYRQIGPSVYGKLTAGYLERAFGGVAAEVLYQPEGRKWALGAELAMVAQRDTNGGLGFGEYDYQTTTGHLSGYYELGNGFEAQVDVGRYLAGDVGGTFTLMRTFENGWKIGAFATITNVSPEDFGEGSFDKGIRMEIPLSYFTNRPTRSVRDLALRPLGRDGGARLQVDDRLRDVLRGQDVDGLTAQWGRFWK